MVCFYTLRYPYNNNNKFKELLVDFGEANYEPDPKCLLDKSWENIKLDFYDFVNL